MSLTDILKAYQQGDTLSDQQIIDGYVQLQSIITPMLGQGDYFKLFNMSLIHFSNGLKDIAFARKIELPALNEKSPS